jgi:hypothetical protein
MSLDAGNPIALSQRRPRARRPPAATYERALELLEGSRVTELACSSAVSGAWRPLG